VIYFAAGAEHRNPRPCGNNFLTDELTSAKDITMGDRSPKSNKKLATQKKSKTDQSSRGKQAQIDAGHARKDQQAKKGK